jgi:hypothetical protein
MEVTMTYQRDPNRPLDPDEPVQPIANHDRDLETRPMPVEDDTNAWGTIAVVVVLAALAIGAIMYFMSGPSREPTRQTSVQERTLPSRAPPTAPQQ